MASGSERDGRCVGERDGDMHWKQGGPTKNTKDPSEGGLSEGAGGAV